MSTENTPSQASMYQQLRSHLSELKLTAAAEALAGLLDEATVAGWSTTETLTRIMSVEVEQCARMERQDNPENPYHLRGTSGPGRHICQRWRVIR